MLLTTSRKPSSQTRKFCKNFYHATGFNYINRGKSSLREILLKAIELEENYIAIVNEIKGNPSKITFYSNSGDIKLIILISISLTNERLNINVENLKIKSDFSKLDILSEIFHFKIINEDVKEDYIHIAPVENDEDKIAKITFYDKFGNLSDFQIYIRKILDSDA